MNRVVTAFTEQDYFYLSCLAELGIQAKLSSAGRINLAPTRLITPKITQVVNEHRAEITDEIIRWNNRSHVLRPRSLTTDPRPELHEDSALWQRLLVLAQARDPNLAGTLHGFRCCGARLRRSATGWHVVYAPESDWPDEAAFCADRVRWLQPDQTYIGLRDSPMTKALAQLLGA